RAFANSGAFSRITVLAGSEVYGEVPDHLGPAEIEYCWQPGQLNARKAILSRIRELNPDLIWFNLRMGMFGESPWLSLSNLVIPMLARWLGFPTVVTFHELIEMYDFQSLKAPGGLFAPLGARLITSLVTRV